jgi:molybdate transport system substrate-binding protein
MQRKPIVFPRILGFLLAAMLGGCNSKRPAPSGQPRAVMALVAASAQDAVNDLSPRFTADTGVEVHVVADDSGKLAQQIANGAPAQVFLSANKKWVDFLAGKGLIAERTDLLGNSLVIVVPANGKATVHDPADLLAPQIAHIALAGPNVPAGIYGRQALTKLGLLDKLEEQKKIVSGENVRATLAYAERGETEAAIVYSTDARISDKVRAVYTFPASTHDPIVYPLVLLMPEAKTADGGSDAGRKFYDFLKSPAAADAFRRRGFGTPETPDHLPKS